ncbi:MAG: RDD family protein [Candidatus Wildermuthbacteria bacterium]|nr:RDD family protein [Candidatus Wildermuthbacteria bacterium]
MNKVSPFDPDFLLFALPFAFFIDALDFVFEIGIIANLFLAIPLIWWMSKKGGQAPGAKDIQLHAQERQAAKAAGKRALRRGLLIFVAELIPILNLFPFWLIAVFAMLRQQGAHLQDADLRDAPRLIESEDSLESERPTQQTQEAV